MDEINVTQLELDTGVVGNMPSSQAPTMANSDPVQTHSKRKTNDEKYPQPKQSRRWNSQTLQTSEKLLEYALKPTTPPAEIQASMKKMLDISESKKLRETESRDALLTKLKHNIQSTICLSKLIF
jgi:hypothetical protein